MSLIGPEIKKTLEAIKAEHGEEIIDPPSAAFLGRDEKACRVKDLTQIQLLQYAYAVTTQQLEETVKLFNALVEEKNRVSAAVAKLLAAQMGEKANGGKSGRLLVPDHLNREARRRAQRNGK